MDASGENSGSLDWNTDDEHECQSIIEWSASSFTSALPGPSVRGHVSCNPDEEASSSNSALIQRFKDMGFPEEIIERAVREHGEEENENSIVETILTYKSLESIPEPAVSNQSSSEYDESFLDDFSDSGSFCGVEENRAPTSEDTLQFVQSMGYTKEAASMAMERCGSEASVDELVNFILADEMSNTCEEVTKKRKLDDSPFYGRKKKHGHIPNPMIGPMKCHMPNPMIGFGVPAEMMPANAPLPVIQRSLRNIATGPPFFYFENVALAPQGVWERISQSLYDINPEFVDSKFFCAAQRKRGYVHNLPLKGRFPLKPLTHRTIHDAFPSMKRWWPKWDERKQLNCIQTAIGSAPLTDKIMNWVKDYDGQPPQDLQKEILAHCRRWNLVWTGKYRVAPLEADEMEYLMGFPTNHTRGGGVSRTDRFKSLGNAFQVDTIAYHLSVLKAIFPRGINILSLFSGIGGAEVALHKLGIPLKNVVSVEKVEGNRNIVASWWEQTRQPGKLIHYNDVQEMDEGTLNKIMKSIGGFDLVIGGSPCNNLSSSNRVSRDGLDGRDSSLFFEFVRILKIVKRFTTDK